MPWLMKAEPDSRIVKGKDVKFSIDDFEKLGVSPWDGVRNHEAKKIMKEKMKLGDKVLFYHSNTKIPGVFGLAEIEKEGYPDYTAWDPSHPYFDEKSSKDSPTWYMVSVKFIEKLPYPPTLALIKYVASLPPSKLPWEIDYIGSEGLEAIRNMQLINRGRLSVQPVEQAAYDAVVLLGTRGGWEDLVVGKSGKGKTKAGKGGTGDIDLEVEVKKRGKGKKNGVVAKDKFQVDDEQESELSSLSSSPENGVFQGKKRKLSTKPVKSSENNLVEPSIEGGRRSKRLKR